MDCCRAIDAELPSFLCSACPSCGRQQSMSPSHQPSFMGHVQKWRVGMMRDVSLCPEEWWRDFRLWSKEESLETAEWGPVNERYQETAFNSIEMGHWTTRIISKRKELSFQEVSSPSLEVIKQREITAKQTCHGWSRYRLSGWCTGSLQTLCPLGRWNQWLLEVLGGVYLTWETIFPTCHWGERGSSLSLSLSLESCWMPMRMTWRSVFILCF